MSVCVYVLCSRAMLVVLVVTTIEGYVHGWTCGTYTAKRVEAVLRSWGCVAVSRQCTVDVCVDCGVTR